MLPGNEPLGQPHQRRYIATGHGEPDDTSTSRGLVLRVSHGLGVKALCLSAAATGFVWKDMRVFILRGVDEGHVLDRLTIISLMHTIDSQPCILLADLSCFNGAKTLNWGQSRVLSQCHWDGIKCICERPHGILLESRGLNS